MGKKELASAASRLNSLLSLEDARRPPDPFGQTN